MVEVRVGCNLCGSDKNRPVLKPYGRTYVACRKCGLVFLDPMPSPEHSQRFYTEKASSDPEVEEHRAGMYENFLEKIEKLKPKRGRLLDVGCGYGEFMKMARGYGWEVFGIELSYEACEYIRRRYGLPVYSRSLPEVGFPSEYFDVVTMWNVLDHIPDPLGHLREARRVIKADGVLFVRVPNFPFQRVSYHIGRLIGKLTGYDLAHKVSVFHLYCFTHDSLRRILKEAGFGVVRILNSRPSRGDPYAAFPPGLDGVVRFGKYLIYLATQVLFFATGGEKALGPPLDA